MKSNGVPAVAVAALPETKAGDDPGSIASESGWMSVLTLLVASTGTVYWPSATVSRSLT